MLTEARKCIAQARATGKIKWLLAARYWIASAQCARLFVQS